MVPDEVRPVSEVSVPAMVLLPVTEMPPVVTVKVLPSVVAPVLVTLSLTAPPTCMLIKSPAKLAGLLPINVPLALPLAIAAPSLITDAVALALGVPLSTKASDVALKVLAAENVCVPPR